jgi:Mg-chelatase subunit ChlD
MNARNIIHNCARFLDICKQPVPQDHDHIHEKMQYRDSVLVIDGSPSMHDTDWPPSRMAAAQQAAMAFVKRLFSEEPDAMVAIVSYGDYATLLCDLTTVANYHQLKKGINSIEGGSGTNITAGLEIALDLRSKSQRTGQVVLLTDGWHNTGSDPKPISDKLREKATIECIGIGGSPADVDEELLKYIASSRPDGSKRYRWIGDKERLVEHFHNLAGRIVRA